MRALGLNWLFQPLFPTRSARNERRNALAIDAKTDAHADVDDAKTFLFGSGFHLGPLPRHVGNAPILGDSATTPRRRTSFSISLDKRSQGPPGGRAKPTGPMAHSGRTPRAYKHMY